MNTQFDTATRPKDAPRLIRAAALIDAAGTAAAPGAVLARGSEILAAGSPQSIGEVSEADVVDLPRSVLIPALVNAHTHLDLSHIGPKPFDGDFSHWVDAVRASRARSDDAIAAAVAEGVRLSRAGGTCLVGDIAGVRSTVPTAALRQSGLGGVSFFEVFGVGRTQAAAIEVMRDAARLTAGTESGVRFGVQPHAPYSCGPEVYRAAAGLGAPMSTHLAETKEELEFVRDATGPLADMLKRFGVWDDSIAASGRHPVEEIADLLNGRPCLAAHVNYIDDPHLARLARSNITVAYCPRASAYFGHSNHQYELMIEEGVIVVLGTDSIVCLDTPDRISTLDEMRLLHRRDGVEPIVALRMATTAGALALGGRKSLVTFSRGESAGVLALETSQSVTNARDALSQALLRDDAPTWVLGPVPARNEWFE